MTPRVVSLLPAATEIACALGASAELCGISHECDFPDSIRGLPVLTCSRLGELESSGAIDAAVRTRMRDALSIYAVDEQRLAALKPDLILTQDLCQVCAVSLDDVESAVARLAHRDHVRILSLRPTRLAHVLADIETVSGALGRVSQGLALCSELDRRIAAIAARARHAAERPRVVSLEWLDPLMLGGTWMPELIELAAGHAVGPAAGSPALTLSATEFAQLQPDVVLIKPCGFDLARSLRERQLIGKSVLGVLAPRVRVYLSDGNAFFNRPGPRLVESLEILAACIHPGLFADFAQKHRAVLVPLAGAAQARL